MKSAFNNDLFRDVITDDNDNCGKEIMENEGNRPSYDEYLRQRNRVIKRMYKVDEFTVEELVETFNITEDEVKTILESI